MPTFLNRPLLRRASLLGWALIALSTAPLPLVAQLVTPKTVPVHQGEQFDIYPSSRPGMAGVSLAVEDTLLDPFVNPAKAARVGGGRFFGSAYAHSISGERGGGWTLPVGAMASLGGWSVAGIAALQQLDRAGPVWNRPTSQQTATNRYVSAAVARRLTDGLDLGLGAFHSSLGAVDGVDLLYAGSDRIEQDGSVTDLRLGLVKAWSEARSLELLLLHNRTDVTHDVHFPQAWRWDPITGAPLALQAARSERNVDRTHIWGAHTEYTHPLGTEGWRLGWLATANRLSHPKIPNYVIMNIPRDPGTTYSFNAGVGAGRTVGPLSIGVDVIYEPMWSETWADAEADTATASGKVIPAGGRTVENAFRFSNSKIRAGVSRDMALSRDSATTLGVQFGVSVYSIDYDLEQTNHVLNTYREQTERWMEWSPSWAFRLRTPDLELTYAFRLTCGPGGCDVPGPVVQPTQDMGRPGGGGIIAAPSGPLFFDGGTVSTHRITFSVPIR